jgi:ABC-type branched-subunit amino acid transport system ATPase component
MENHTLLTLKNIHVSFLKKEVLHGVSLSVKKGEVVSLIGPNGAGKSTLLKVICGILTPIKGKVFLDGIDITSVLPHIRVKKGIAYFIQGGSVFSDLTIKENLEMGGFDLPKSVLKKQMEDVLTLFPLLSEALSQRAGLLSGGGKQMLALGMILMKMPQILLLDEPSAGLSPKFVSELIGKVKEIHQKKGVTILLVEQNIKEVLKISENVYLLKNGEVVGEEIPENLIEEGKLRRIFFGLKGM